MWMLVKAHTENEMIGFSPEKGIFFPPIFLLFYLENLFDSQFVLFIYLGNLFYSCLPYLNIVFILYSSFLFYSFSYLFSGE